MFTVGEKWVKYKKSLEKNDLFSFVDIIKLY